MLPVSLVSPTLFFSADRNYCKMARTRQNARMSTGEAAPRAALGASCVCAVHFSLTMRPGQQARENGVPKIRCPSMHRNPQMKIQVVSACNNSTCSFAVDTSRTEGNPGRRIRIHGPRLSQPPQDQHDEVSQPLHRTSAKLTSFSFVTYATTAVTC